MLQADPRALVEAAPDPIAVLDREQRYVYVNPALARLTGAAVGGRADAGMAPEEARAWREAVAEVLRTGRARSLEHTRETPGGPRWFSVQLAALPGEHACAVWRDLTDVAEVRSGRLIERAALAMTTGIVIVEAPSGRVLFKNAETDRLFGERVRDVRGSQDYDQIVAFDPQGRRVARDAWPISRALAGETTLGARVEVPRLDGTRCTVSINSSPIRDGRGEIIAAVSTYYDITDAWRAHEAASFLAEAGALLERFDPETSLQAIVDLAVPVLADWCFIHLGHLDPERPALAAIAHADRAKAAAVRARYEHSPGVTSDTAVARVLAGGPREIVTVDDAVLEHAARDPAHLAELRAHGFRSAVFVPLAGREGVLGVVTFAMAESGRRYVEADLDVLVELARRTGIALENARLLAAEQQARRRAEEARDRTRRLQALTAALSSVLERSQVLAIMVDAGRAALDAAAGFAWWLRPDDMVELGATALPETGYAGRLGHVDSFRTIPASAQIPVCDSIRTAQPLMFESAAALLESYPLVPAGTPFQAWAVIPLVVGGRGAGAVTFSFETARAFSEEDRELLIAMAGQASLALDRCLLVEAERRARADAEAARARERELQVIAARLSSALTPQQVAAIATEEVVTALRAHTGVAAIRVGDEVHLIGSAGTQDAQVLASASRVPLGADRPMAEAIRTGALVWCGSEAELAARYPHLEAVWRGVGLRAWGAVPFTFEGRTIGGLAISFTEDHALRDDERELLHGAGQLAAQALERARLYDALRASEEQLRVALTAARAATWSVDLATMQSTRDPSFLALLGVRDARVAADFGAIHPDDRASARAHFERALRDGVPYEPEVRMRRDDGTYTWIRSHGRVTYGEDGKPTGLAGVAVDIDEAKRASLAAEEERRVNETLYRLGSSFTSVLDHDRLVALITDEIARLLGAELGEFRPSGGGDARPPGLGSYLEVPVAARSGEPFGSLRFGHPEAGRFTAAHERLAASIASQAAVALENARLYRTVREQKEQLELAVVHAKLADRRKDEFLAMLGHELRNPLAPISTALELMSLKGGGVLQRERDVIRRQVDHLSRLIEDLLDVSRITRGKIQLARQVLELGTVLAKAVEMASPLLDKRMQRLTIEVPREGLLVDADPTRLAQVFQNLLTNAAKYSEPHTHITLRAHGEAEGVVVEVSDQGIGIPADILPRLFELFVQGERALDRAEGGLGIGLTIAKSLCELHGGTIEVASAGPGRGSTFTVRLPLATRAADPPVRRTGEHMVRVPSGVRVLIVDDNVDAAVMLHEFIGGIGHQAAVAHDGMSALEVASAFWPDVALLDIGLPVMDGYELARRMREQAGGRPLCLIAVTGYGQESDRARARQAGFDHHMVKPIELEALVPLLASAGTAGV